MHYWVLLGAAIAFLSAIYLLWKEVTLRRRGVRTTGVIVDVKRESVNDGLNYSVTFRPIIQFITCDGQQIVWKCTNSGANWENAYDKQMQIIYDPRNPQRVIRDHWSDYAWIMFSCLMGTLCIVTFFIGTGG